MRGHIDRATRDVIEGWAWDPTKPDETIALQIYDNAIAIGEVVADLARDDLRLSGIGDGRHAFKWLIPGGLSPAISHLIEVRRKSDGWKLRGFEAPLVADPEFAAAVSAPLKGNLDFCDRHFITGWAVDDAQLSAPVPLQILCGDVLIARVLANHYREDLEKAGFGDGRRAFQVRLPNGLSLLERHVIRVRHELDAREIPGSPYVIEPSDSFDSALEQAVAKAIDGLAIESDQDRVLSFLTLQTDRLLQKRAERDSKRVLRLAFPEFRKSPGSFTEEPADPGRRALVIDDEYPDARRDAGSQAILSHMRTLQNIGYSISFAATQDGTPQNSEIEELRIAGIETPLPPYYTSIEDIFKRQRGCFDLIYLHRISNAEKYLALARHYNKRAWVIYSVADLHYVRVARQAATERRPELLAHSRHLQFAELASAVKANAVVTHSREEAETLRRSVPAARVYVVPWEVPLLKIDTPIAERHGIAFVAGFRHRPNIDAAWFLINKIMPLVWQCRPTMPCVLAGSNIPDVIQNLAGPQVEILGSVEYLEEIFARVRLTVAPLQFGAGVKGKILNSFAAGIPCVMTPIGAEGLSLSGELETLVGENTDELARLIVQLHDDIDGLARLSALCREFVGTQYSAQATTIALRAATTRN
jgi:glycosyltransferase involved in cell wall biosynthesis